MQFQPKVCATLLLLMTPMVQLGCGDSAGPALTDAEAPYLDASFDGGVSDRGLLDASLDDATAIDLGPELGVDAGQDGGVGEDQGIDAGSAGALDPVLFVHGISGSSADFAVMIQRLMADGWPSDHLRAITFPDPRWGCNLDNATIVSMEVDALLASTGATHVDLVAHSMGTLSTRYYLKNLGGTEKVSTYVTLGGLHHGQPLSCLNPLPVCVWQELCPDNDFLTRLNADPATPGELHWVSIYSLTDTTATPAVAHLDGAENIELDGVDHAGPNGLTEHLAAYGEVVRVLVYSHP